MEAKRDGRPLKSPVITKKLKTDKRNAPQVRVHMGAKLVENVSLRKQIRAFMEQVKTGKSAALSTDVLIQDNDSVRALNHIFKITDDLEDVLNELLEGWQSPQVVVIGRENTGKSTILERLCMLPMFPRDAKVCTRMAIRVKVRRTRTQRDT